MGSQKSDSQKAEEDYKFCFESVKSGLQDLGLEYKPTVLVADTAHAITNGFQNVFGDDFARVVCCFHMKESFSKKLKEVKSTDLQTELQEDIELLHNCPTVESFQLGCKLWKMKWKTSKDPLVKSFVTYFISQWMEDNDGWFQGVAPGYPTTNNGMESFNALIKKYHTMRLLLPFNIFLARMKDMLHTYSCDRSGDSPRKVFATRTTCPLKIEKNAYHCHDEIDSYHHKTMDNSITVIYVASSGHTPVSSAAVVTTETKVYRSFKTFKEHFFSFHKIYLNFNDWLLSSCSFVSYQEKLACKHIYGLAVFNILYTFSNKAIDVPLTGKPKRGRPAKVNVGRGKDQSQPSCSQTSKP